MVKIIRKFFDFCGEENRRKFYGKETGRRGQKRNRRGLRGKKAGSGQKGICGLRRQETGGKAQKNHFRLRGETECRAKDGQQKMTGFFAAG